MAHHDLKMTNIGIGFRAAITKPMAEAVGCDPLFYPQLLSQSQKQMLKGVFSHPGRFMGSIEGKPQRFASAAATVQNLPSDIYPTLKVVIGLFIPKYLSLMVLTFERLDRSLMRNQIQIRYVHGYFFNYYLVSGRVFRPRGLCFWRHRGAGRF